MSDADPGPDVARLHALLREQGGSLATAESLTGGRLAALLSAVPGASATYVGGVVAYATEVKIEVLGVPPELVAEHGVVSAPCARAMARGARALTGATYALATTGVAGPDRQEGRAVGTVHVALDGPDPTSARVASLQLRGDRAGIVEQTCRRALALLEQTLDDRPRG